MIILRIIPSLLSYILFLYRMPQFSLSSGEYYQKLRSMFQACSQDGKHLKPIQLMRMVNDLGLNNQLFMRDLNYYLPQVERGESITFEELVKFLDYMLGRKKENEAIEAFKCFDRNGSGQIQAADLLAVLKKQISPKSYELYSHLITSSYGPLINYMDLFGAGKKYK